VCSGGEAAEQCVQLTCGTAAERRAARFAVKHFAKRGFEFFLLPRVPHSMGYPAKNTLLKERDKWGRPKTVERQKDSHISNRIGGKL